MDKQERTCPSCDTFVPDNSWFCPACNSPLDKESDILEEEPAYIEEKPDTLMKGPGRIQRKDTTTQANGIGVLTSRHEYFAKSWIIRIIISIIIIALLIGAILIISHVRKHPPSRPGALSFRRGLIIQTEKSQEQIFLRRQFSSVPETIFGKQTQ